MQDLELTFVALGARLNAISVLSHGAAITFGSSLLQFRFTATISSPGYRSATLLVWYAYTSVLSLIFVRIKGFSSGVRIVSYTLRPAARVRILLHHLFFHLVVVVVAVVVVIVVVVS